MYIFILLVCILFLLTWEVKFTKKDVSEIFGVENRTLKKWVHWFCPKAYSAKWKNRRKLSASEFLRLLLFFDRFELAGSMNKEEIATKCESDTKTLRGEVLSKLAKLGLTKESYDNLSVFPPFMSARLV